MLQDDGDELLKCANWYLKCLSLRIVKINIMDMCVEGWFLVLFFKHELDVTVVYSWAIVRYGKRLRGFLRFPLSSVI
eukprot:snap_masked-scaffold_18-processed-gene-6.32-mRNA-1 protein AED:1.00 eAED:1.00 QI:0/0/0/0/1/1/2/0/76